MRLRLLAALSAVTLGVLAMAGPVLAGSGASQNTSAGGSSASTGNSSSSASISTGGGGSVGVVQGNVSGGSTAGGSNRSSSGGGSSSSGGGTASTAETQADVGPNAAQDGVVSQLDLPAMGTVDDAIPASGIRSNVIIIGLAAIFAVGLFVLYRKLPRARAVA